MFLIKTLLEAASLSALILVTQLFLFPQMGLLAPSQDGVIGASFATFVVYAGMALIHRSKHNEKS